MKKYHCRHKKRKTLNIPAAAWALSIVLVVSLALSGSALLLPTVAGFAQERFEFAGEAEGSKDVSLSTDEQAAADTEVSNTATEQEPGEGQESGAEQDFATGQESGAEQALTESLSELAPYDGLAPELSELSSSNSDDNWLTDPEEFIENGKRIEGKKLNIYVGSFEGAVGNPLKIPEGITSIQSSAFKGVSLVSLEIPSSVREIAADAFSSNKELKELILHPGLRTIGRSAFEGCPLTTLALPEGIQSIGERAFAECKELQELSLPLATYTMHDEAFRGTTALQSSAEKPLVISGNIGVLGTTGASLPTGAFQESGLTHVVFGSGVATIKAEAFKDSGLVSVVLPSTLRTIEEAAFENCHITTIDIPKTVAVVQSRAFASCSELKEVRIPASVSNLNNAEVNSVFKDIAPSAQAFFEKPSQAYTYLRDSFASYQVTMQASASSSEHGIVVEASFAKGTFTPEVEERLSLEARSSLEGEDILSPAFKLSFEQICGIEIVFKDKAAVMPGGSVTLSFISPGSAGGSGDGNAGGGLNMREVLACKLRPLNEGEEWLQGLHFWLGSTSSRLTLAYDPAEYLDGLGAWTGRYLLVRYAQQITENPNYEKTKQRRENGLMGMHYSEGMSADQERDGDPLFASALAGANGDAEAKRLAAEREAAERAAAAQTGTDLRSEEVPLAAPELSLGEFLEANRTPFAASTGVVLAFVGFYTARARLIKRREEQL